MAHINLLDWRKELRAQKQQEFFAAAGMSAVFAVLVVGFFHFDLTGDIENQNSRNQYLRSEIKIVEGQIEEIKNLEKQKQQLVERMKVIEQLQRDRPVIVHLFDELVRATPDGLYFTNVVQTGTLLSIEGIAQSNARVSSLMRSIEASPWLENPVLEIIQAEKGDLNRKFKLRVTQTSSAQPQDAAQAEQTQSSGQASADQQPKGQAQPAGQTAPTEEKQPAGKTQPEGQAAPAAQTQPAGQAAPAAETQPAGQAAPAAETQPAGQAAPAAETQPAGQAAPAAQTQPAGKPRIN